MGGGRALKETTQVSPVQAGAHLNLGNALARQGRFEEALASYGRALALDPRFPEAHINQGHALLELGRLEEALESYRRAIAARPTAEAHDHAGNVLLALGRVAEASACFRRAILCEPRFFAAHDHLGNALAELGRTDEAVQAYRRALDLNPSSAEVHNNLGSLQRACGRLDEALAYFARAVSLRPDFAEAHCNLGLVQRLKSRPAEAQQSCARALALKPGYAPALLVLADVHADQGDFAGADQYFRRAIAADPDSPEAFAGLSRLRKMTSEDSGWLSEAQRIAARASSPSKEAYLRYAIGKYFDDTGEFDLAFASYRRANELKRLCRPPHDSQAMTRSVNRIIESQDRDWIARVRPESIAAHRPVFIVGMLRSGTTLAEQILASHPEVHGAGELPFWSAVGEAACEDRITPLAMEYLRILAALAPDAQRVVDKMPGNFMALGLIHAALPNARIIHMRRDPMDTCLSIYFQHFETAVTYANDLEDLARYYTEYCRLMQHWRSTLPADVLLEVPYEALVREPEQWSRNMLEHIGLPWDSRCLDFHLTHRTIITASKWQVRQAINEASIGRWRNYDKYLGPLRRILLRTSSS